VFRHEEEAHATCVPQTTSGESRRSRGRICHRWLALGGMGRQLPADEDSDVTLGNPAHPALATSANAFHVASARPTEARVPARTKRRPQEERVAARDLERHFGEWTPPRLAVQRRVVFMQGAR